MYEICRISNLNCCHHNYSNCFLPIDLHPSCLNLNSNRTCFQTFCFRLADDRDFCCCSCCRLDFVVENLFGLCCRLGYLVFCQDGEVVHLQHQLTYFNKTSNENNSSLNYLHIHLDEVCPSSFQGRSSFVLWSCNRSLFDIRRHRLPDFLSVLGLVDPNDRFV